MAKKYTKQKPFYAIDFKGDGFYQYVGTPNRPLVCNNGVLVHIARTEWEPEIINVSFMPGDSSQNLCVDLSIVEAESLINSLRDALEDAKKQGKKK